MASRTLTERSLIGAGVRCIGVRPGLTRGWQPCAASSSTCWRWWRGTDRLYRRHARVAGRCEQGRAHRRRRDALDGDDAAIASSRRLRSVWPRPSQVRPDHLDTRPVHGDPSGLCHGPLPRPEWRWTVRPSSTQPRPAQQEQIQGLSSQDTLSGQPRVIQPSPPQQGHARRGAPCPRPGVVTCGPPRSGPPGGTGQGVPIHGRSPCSRGRQFFVLLWVSATVELILRVGCMRSCPMDSCRRV